MILWADSFDHYGSSSVNMTDGPWAEVGAGWSLSTAHPRTGARGIKCTGGATNSLRRVFGGEYTKIGVGFPVYMPALPTANDCQILSEFRDNANKPQVTLTVQSTGALAIWTGRATGLLPVHLEQTSSALITANSQNHVEMFAVCDSVIGAIEVRLNGVTVLNVSGINTDRQGSGNFAQWGSLGLTLNTGGERYYDDIIAWEADTTGGFNDDFVGDKKVYTDFPDADTITPGWVPSSGVDLWAMVDEADPDGDTSYDEAAEAGDRMGLAFPNVAVETISIAAIILLHKTRKTDAGTANVQVSAESNGSEIAGADRPMTTAFTVYQDVFEVDPDTLAPWTPSGANAMSCIVERTA